MAAWPVISGLSPAWLLIGATAALLPILIHLWGGPRVRRLVYPAARFARQAAAQAGRRRRLRDRALLMSRAAALALLALAFDQPTLTLGGHAGGGDEPRSLVVVIDASASMSRSEGGITLFDRARERARALLTSLDAESDRAAVVLIGERPVAMLPTMSGNLTALMAALAATTPTAQRGDADAALSLARAMLDQEPPERTRQMFVLTDLQASQWERATTPADIAVRLERVGAEEARGNWSVSDLAAEHGSRAETTLSARVWNQSDEPGEAAVRFFAGEVEAGIAMARLEARGNGVVSVAAALDETGRVPIRVELASRDALASDNIARSEVSAALPARSAIVRGGPIDAERYVSAALDAATGAAPAWLEANDLRTSALGDFGIVAAAGDRLGRSEIEALRGFAAGGGLVFLFVGAQGERSEPNDPLWAMRFDALNQRSESTPPFDTELQRVIDGWTALGDPPARPARALPWAEPLVNTDAGSVVARGTVGLGSAVTFNLEIERSRVARTPWFPAMISALIDQHRARAHGTATTSDHINPREGDLRAATRPASAGDSSMVEVERDSEGVRVALWAWLALASAAMLAIEGWVRTGARGKP